MIDKPGFISEVLCVDQFLLLHNFESEERVLFIQNRPGFLFHIIDDLPDVLDYHVVFVDWLHQE